MGKNKKQEFLPLLNKNYPPKPAALSGIPDKEATHQAQNKRLLRGFAGQAIFKRLENQVPRYVYFDGALDLNSTVDFRTPLLECIFLAGSTLLATDPTLDTKDQKNHIWHIDLETGSNQADPFECFMPEEDIVLKVDPYWTEENMSRRIKLIREEMSSPSNEAPINLRHLGLVATIA